MTSLTTFTTGSKSYWQKLPPGDKAILVILGAFFIIAAIVGLLALERSFLISEPAYGGSLREGVMGAPRFVNPLLALSDADDDLVRLTYAGLMGYDAERNLVPVLASGYTISPDGKTYTFTLRTGAKFSDGTPVTADDVVYTVSKAQDPALKSPQFANWANVQARAIDSRTVSFMLPKAYAPFIEDATLGILPAHVWKDVSDAEFPFAPQNTLPVGAGPFTVKNAARDKAGVVKEYDLSAFGGYALGRPYLSAIHLVFYPDAASLSTGYTSGEFESAYGLPNAPGTGHVAQSAPYSRVFGVFFNQKQNPALARLEVRKALSVALDRTKLVQDVLGGYATPLFGPVPPTPGVILTQNPVASSTDSVAAAKQILLNNGWTEDASTTAWKHGKDKLTLAITITTGTTPELKATASIVKTAWEALGVPTTVVLDDPSTLTASVIRPRSYDALLFGMVVGEGRDLFAFWNSSEIKDPGLNIAGYADTSVDALLSKFRSETDPAAEDADLSKIDSSIASAYPAAFLYAPDFLYDVPDDLEGVALGPLQEPADRFNTVAFWYRNTEAVWPALARTH